MIEAGRQALPLVMVSLAALVLAGATAWLGRDEYSQLVHERGEAGESRSAAPTASPTRGVVKLDAAARAAAGIVTAPLEAASAGAGIEIRGVVVDLRPLIEARGRHLALAGEQRAARVAAAASEAEYQRAAALFRDDRNVSERAMLAAQTQAAADRERVLTAEAALRNSQDALRATWGSALADLAVSPQPDALAAFAEQRAAIVQMTVPDELLAGVRAHPAMVTTAGGGAATPARFLSLAPSTVAGAAGAPGASVFLRAESTSLRPGVRAIGRITTGDGETAGVAIPEGAVVWHAGRAWAYRESRPGIFQRVPVAATQPIAGGWFNATGFEAGQQVVVLGAQLLLSEEQEYQIRNENED